MPEDPSASTDPAAQAMMLRQRGEGLYIQNRIIHIQQGHPADAIKYLIQFMPCQSTARPT